MLTIYAKEQNVTVGKDVSVALSALLKSLRDTEQDKELIFEKGDYYLSSSLCDKEILYITNSTADKEWRTDEVFHENRVGINLQGIKNLRLDGSGANFILDGQFTNIVVQDCENVVIENLSLTTVNPNMHELRVVKVAPFYVDFELDKESKYQLNGKFFDYVGTDYVYSAIAHRNNSFWIGHVEADNINALRRVPHPLMFCRKVRELEPYKFRAYFWIKRRFVVGERFYPYDNRRKEGGIFINRSRNVCLTNVAQHYNNGLALVLQDTDTVTCDKLFFAPKAGSAKLVASVADFIQVCMCRGDIVVKDSYFEGAGDDCLNVHGVHFAIKSIEGNKLTVAFMHDQTLGYNPLHAGDTIEYVNTDTLLPKGTATITESILLNNYEIQLTVDDTTAAHCGDVIEDTDACPNLYFSNNVLNRIITRGLLITTRGKVVVENNHFKDTTMHGILVSDDAKNWYESGRVLDLTIQNNIFERCPQYNVCVMPENSAFGGAVHKNIKIVGNKFRSQPGGVYLRCADNVLIEGNECPKGFPIDSKNVTDLVIK